MNERINDTMEQLVRINLKLWKREMQMCTLRDQIKEVNWY